MLPFFRPGDQLVIRSIPAHAVKKLQIIAFKHNGSTELITHRVLKVVNRGGGFIFLTKGDGSRVFDSPVTERNLRGKVEGKIINNEIKKFTPIEEPLTYYLSRIFWIARSIVRGPFYVLVNLLMPMLPLNIFLLKSDSGFVIKVTVFRKVIAQRVVKGKGDVFWYHDIISSSRRKCLAIYLIKYYNLAKTKRNE